MYGGTSADSTKAWTTSKRYNDFVLLNNSLQESGLTLNFPKKKMVGNLGNSNYTLYPVLNVTCIKIVTLLLVDRDFILKRQKELQDYINVILENTELASNINTQRFFDPDNYMINFQGRR